MRMPHRFNCYITIAKQARQCNRVSLLYSQWYGSGARKSPFALEIWRTDYGAGNDCQFVFVASSDQCCHGGAQYGMAQGNRHLPWKYGAQTKALAMVRRRDYTAQTTLGGVSSLRKRVCENCPEDVSVEIKQFMEGKKPANQVRSKKGSSQLECNFSYVDLDDGDMGMGAEELGFGGINSNPSSIGCRGGGVVWNPWDKKAKALPDFGDEDYETMLCVDSAAIENPFVLKPCEEWKGRQELSTVSSSYFSGQLDPRKALRGFC
ncbi:hypothetical protein IFM89_003088 [Coptis chinensis]|uniref:Uncharacterized protein n=1 Tax=Coptis chinensis TaxID=261450 RepID=A0A835I7G2_9MAGN|nr:hypothetical protein IFM89_003088 [Coptis chinensis]